MKIKLSATAEQQVQAGYRFYERQSEGLGDYFLDSLMADIESLHIYAGVHAVFFGRYHRLLTKEEQRPVRIVYERRNRDFDP